MSGRAVFLDRDGVLNRNVIRGGRPFPPARAADIAIIPGAPEACRSLKRHGYQLIVVTNQPDIARGRETAAEVEAANRAILAATDVDAFYVCMHDDADNCPCRKPKPGLLLRAAHERDIDLAQSVMVGDRWRDIEAGRRAGCRTILVDGGHEEPLTVLPDLALPSLADAARLLAGAS